MVNLLIILTFKLTAGVWVGGFRLIKYLTRGYLINIFNLILIKMIKYGTTKSNFAKNTRRNKRISRRVPRPIKLTGMSMRVEYDQQLYFTQGSNTARLSATANSYLDFATILGGNPAFISQCSNYTKYKITGCSLTCTPIFSETGINTAFTTNGIPIIYAQQYPTITGTPISLETATSDNNMMIKPLSLTQSKYWSYKSNYLIGLGNGVGVWNQSNNYSLQQGEFAITGPNWCPAPAIQIIMYAVRACLYVQLDGKAR